jgi:hypothetical protein
LDKSCVAALEEIADGCDVIEIPERCNLSPNARVQEREKHAGVAIEGGSEESC